MARKIKKSLTDQIVQKLDDNKAENIRLLDIRGKSSFADWMVIATGTSTRHVVALAHHLVQDLKSKDRRPLNDFTRTDGQWAVVDLGDIIVHLFTSDTRALYDLESLWQS